MTFLDLGSWLARCVRVLRGWFEKLDVAAFRGVSIRSAPRRPDGHASPRGDHFPKGFDPSDLEVEGVSVSHKYVFDLGCSINPLEAAKTLLGNGLARAAILQSSPAIFTPDGYEAVVDARNELLEIQRVMDSGSFAAYAFRRPKYWVRFFTIFFKVILDVVLPTRNKAEPPAEEEEESIDDAVESMNVLVKEVLRNGVIVSLLRDSENRILSPMISEEDHWVRLELDPLFASEEGTENTLDVHILVHRSGFIVLTIYEQFDRALKTDELFEAVDSSKKCFETLDIPTVIPRLAEGQIGERTPKASSIRNDGPVERGVWEFSNSVSTLDLAELYQLALIEALGDKGPRRPYTLSGLAGLPVLAIRNPGPDFPVGEDASVLAGRLVSRSRDVRRKDALAVGLKQRCNVRAANFWLERTGALMIHSPERTESLIKREGNFEDICLSEFTRSEQHLSVTAEVLLMAECATKIAQISSARVEPNIESLQSGAGVILALEDDFFGADFFRVALFNDLLASLKEDFGAKEKWALIHRRFSILAEDTERLLEENTRKVQTRLTRVVALLTLLAALPAVSFLVDNVGGLVEEGSIKIGWIGSYLSEEPAASKLVLFVLLAILILLLSVGKRPSKKYLILDHRPRNPSRSPNVIQGEHQVFFKQE